MTRVCAVRATAVMLTVVCAVRFARAAALMLSEVCAVRAADGLSSKVGAVVYAVMYAVRVVMFTEVAEVATSAGGRGASVSACAGLTNQLLSCWVDPCIAWKKHRQVSRS